MCRFISSVRRGMPMPKVPPPRALAEATRIVLFVAGRTLQALGWLSNPMRAAPVGLSTSPGPNTTDGQACSMAVSSLLFWMTLQDGRLASVVNPV
jgi:hypothetical protein